MIARRLIEEVTRSGGGGGGQPLVYGEFTVGSTGDRAESVSIPYTGDGYPLLIALVVKGGTYGNKQNAWTTIIKQYAIETYLAIKRDFTNAPDYSGSGQDDSVDAAWKYKNSTSSATSTTGGITINGSVFKNANASGGSAAAAIIMKNKNTLSYYVGNGTSKTYGLMPDVTYQYYIIYSQ